MRTRTIAAAATLVLATGITVSACGGGSSSAPPPPPPPPTTTSAPAAPAAPLVAAVPTATSVLAADGYTLGTTPVSTTELLSQFGGQAYATTAAGAINSSTGYEIVIILTDQGVAALDAQGGPSALQSYMNANGGPTYVVTLSGDVLRLDASSVN